MMLDLARRERTPRVGVERVDAVSHHPHFRRQKLGLLLGLEECAHVGEKRRACLRGGPQRADNLMKGSC